MSSPTMRAWRYGRFGDASVMELVALPMPRPGEGELLVRVVAAAVNPIDWKIRDGVFPHALPNFPGQDFAGLVAGAGEGVDAWPEGTPVFGMLPPDRTGAYAEYVTVSQKFVARKPGGVSFVQAAALPTGALTARTAMVGIGAVQTGQRVLVHGAAGGVGALAVQLAKARGAWVAATASGAGLDLVARLGVDLLIDYQAERFETAVAGETLHLVLDTVGGDTRTRSWPLLAPGGKMVSTLGPTEPPAQFAARGVLGAPGFGTVPDGAGLREIAALAQANTLGIASVHAHAFELAPEAMDLNQLGRVAGKVVLVMCEAPDLNGEVR